MADFSFQLFSPLRSPPKKKKKKDKYEHKEESQDVTVLAIDGERDSHVHSAVSKDPETKVPSTRKRKNTDDFLTSSKKARKDQMSKPHELSDSDGEVKTIISQILSPRAQRMVAHTSKSPELFSEFDSEVDSLVSFSLSPRKKQMSSEQKQTTSPKKHKSSPEKNISSPQKSNSSQKQTTSPDKKTINSGGLQFKRSQISCSSGSWSDSESDSQNSNIDKTLTQANRSQSHHDLSDSSLDSVAEQSSTQRKEPSVEPSPKKTQLQSNTPQAKTSRHNDNSSSSEALSSDSDAGPQHPTKKTPAKTQSNSVTVPAEVPQYVVPVGFKEVEFVESALTAEDVEEDDEIWILRVPATYDISTLDGKDFLLDAVVKIGKRKKDPDVNYQLHSIQSKEHRTSLLLPSKEDKKLHYVGSVAGQMWLSETNSVPAVTIPKPKPLRDTNLPPGLKYRNIAFGAGKLCTWSDVSIRPEVAMSLLKHRKDKKQQNSVVAEKEDLAENTQDSQEVAMPTRKRKKEKKEKKKKKKRDSEAVESEDPVESTQNSQEEFVPAVKRKKEKKRDSEAAESEDPIESPQDFVAVIKRKKEKKKKKKDYEVEENDNSIESTQDVDPSTKRKKEKKKKRRKLEKEEEDTENTQDTLEDSLQTQQKKKKQRNEEN